MIEGVTSGHAVASIVKTDADGRSIVQKRDIVRLGDLLRYLTDGVENLNEFLRSSLL